MSSTAEITEAVAADVEAPSPPTSIPTVSTRASPSAVSYIDLPDNADVPHETPPSGEHAPFPADVTGPLSVDGSPIGDGRASSAPPVVAYGLPDDGGIAPLIARPDLRAPVVSLTPVTPTGDLDECNAHATASVGVQTCIVIRKRGWSTSRVACYVLRR